MARAPQVTRTIQTTRVTVLCLNVNTAEPFNKEIVLPRTYKNDDEILKILRKNYENDEVKFVHIVDTEIEETLYGMSEQKFIEVADILPPRTVAKKD